MMLQALHTRFWIFFLLIPSSSVGLANGHWTTTQKIHRKKQGLPCHQHVDIISSLKCWFTPLQKKKNQSCNDLSFCIKINQQGISGISISIKGAQPVSILPGKNFSVDDSGIPALCSGRLLEAVPAW